MFQSRDMPPSTEEYVLMEQHWVPAKLARQWPRNLQAMQQSLAQLPALKDKRAQAQLLSVLVAVDKALDRLNAATSQEQFDAAIVDLLATAKTALAPAKPKSK
jgi:alanine racemase